MLADRRGPTKGGFGQLPVSGSSQMLQIRPSSGHTIQAPHIEAPYQAFYVEWDSPFMLTAEVGLGWEAGTRFAKVLAETPGGALRIARYHHFMGTNHRLMSKPDNV